MWYSRLCEAGVFIVLMKLSFQSSNRLFSSVWRCWMNSSFVVLQQWQEQQWVQEVTKQIKQLMSKEDFSLHYFYTSVIVWKLKKNTCMPSRWILGMKTPRSKPRFMPGRSPCSKQGFKPIPKGLLASGLPFRFQWQEWFTHWFCPGGDTHFALWSCFTKAVFKTDKPGMIRRNHLSGTV